MQRDLSHFQDRQNAIQAFDNLWKQDSPWILSFNGVAGQGKSTLLDWLEVNRCIPEKLRYVNLPIGDYSSDFNTFLARIIEANTARFSASAGKKFFLARLKALDDLNQRKLQIQQSQTMSGSPDGEQAMSANVREAVLALEAQTGSVIIEHWLSCMRTISHDEKIILLLDNYDVYQDLVSLNEIRTFWNTMERARQFIPNLRIIVASRETVRHQEHVESLRRGISGEGLHDLSREDSQALLIALGVTDSAFCEAVYRLASGHPLITRMSAEAWTQTPGGIAVRDVPNISKREEVVEWLQRQIFNRTEEALRPAARWMMILRWFSFDILNSLLENPLSEDQYQKLTSCSFIIPSKLVEGYRAGHDLVRKVQIDYLRREQKISFIEFHKRAYEYFDKVEGAELEKLYHNFFTSPDEAYQAWEELEASAAFHFNHHLWGLLCELGLRDELSLTIPIQAQIKFRAGRRHYYRAEWFLSEQFYNKALKLFKEIGDRLGEANVRKAIGDVQQFRDDRNAALESYNEALKLFKEIGAKLGEANVLQSHGKLLMFSQKPQEGLQLLQEALNIYTDIESIPSQANIYFFLGQLLASNGQKEKAIEMIDQAIELGNRIDPNHPVSLHMKQFLEQVKNQSTQQ